MLGAALEGVETAEFLVKRGRDVTIIDTSEQLGEGMPPRYLDRLVYWFRRKGVTILTGVEAYDRITQEGIVIRAEEGARLIEADSIIIALPQKPDTRLSDQIRERGFETHLVGPVDEGKSWAIVDAIAQGFNAARSI